MTATAKKISDLPEDIGPRQIELTKVVSEYGTHRGDRFVIVDGKMWGRIFSASHGMHGYSYKVMQFDAAGENEGWVQRKLERLRGDKWKPIEFRPAKVDRHDRIFHDAKPIPIDVQLRGWIAGLIGEGKFRDPADVTAANKAATEKYRRERDTAEAAERAAFEAKARECLNVVGDDVMNEHLGDNVTAEIIARIVAAMKWAQSK